MITAQLRPCDNVLSVALHLINKKKQKKKTHSLLPDQLTD